MADLQETAYLALCLQPALQSLLLLAKTAALLDRLHVWKGDQKNTAASDGATGPWLGVSAPFVTS